MVLSTPAFPDGAVIPNRHTQVQQAERGISPQLVWTNAPAATQSFVLHMHDPEVARNRTTDDQVHWLVWNIPGTEKGLPEGMPEGAQLPNGMRQISASGDVYRGPGAPAAGPMHHYTFEVYALDTKLDVPPAADAWETRRAVFKAMDGHVIGKAVMVGMFKTTAVRIASESRFRVAVGESRDRGDAYGTIEVPAIPNRASATATISYNLPLRRCRIFPSHHQF